MNLAMTRKAALVAGAGGLLVVLTGCQASQTITVDAVTVGTSIRCASGQSFIMEGADADPIGYGAGTEARKDYYCANEDTGTLWWDRLDVQARKYDGNRLCDTSPQRATTTASRVTVSDGDICAATGSNQMHVIGTHGATRPGGGPVPKRELSLTPDVYTF